MLQQHLYHAEALVALHEASADGLHERPLAAARLLQPTRAPLEEEAQSVLVVALHRLMKGVVQRTLVSMCAEQRHGQEWLGVPFQRDLDVGLLLAALPLEAWCRRRSHVPRHAPGFWRRWNCSHSSRRRYHAVVLQQGRHGR